MNSQQALQTFGLLRVRWIVGVLSAPLPQVRPQWPSLNATCICTICSLVGWHSWIDARRHFDRTRHLWQLFQRLRKRSPNDMLLGCRTCPTAVGENALTILFQSDPYPFLKLFWVLVGSVIEMARWPPPNLCRNVTICVESQARFPVVDAWFVVW